MNIQLNSVTPQILQDQESLQLRRSPQNVNQECSLPDYGYSFDQQQLQLHQPENIIPLDRGQVQHGQQAIAVPYFRAPSVSQISMMTTCTTDYDTRMPSEPFLMDEYYSPSMPSFPVHYGMHQATQQHIQLQPLIIQNSITPNYEQNTEIDYSGAPFSLPGIVQQADKIQVKVEAKQPKINNRIIEDDDDDEEEEYNAKEQINRINDSQYYNLFEKYQQPLKVKHESLSNNSNNSKEQLSDQQSAQSLQSGECIREVREAITQPMNSKQRPIKKQYKPKKKYQQSRQKNVFKNFGNALMNCIQNNFMIRDFIEKRLSSNSTLVQAFHNAFLLSHLNNLKNKEDFLQGWRETQPQDTADFILFREIFRQISLTFFNEYAEKYVQESEKLKNKDIHIRAIPLFRKGIHNVSELYTFKLS